MTTSRRRGTRTSIVVNAEHHESDDEIDMLGASHHALASPTRTAEEMDAAETLVSAFSSSGANGVNGRNRAATISESTAATYDDDSASTNGRKRKRAASVNGVSSGMNAEQDERHERLDHADLFEPPQLSLPPEEQPERRHNMIPQMQAAKDRGITGAVASGDREQRRSKPRNFDKVRFGRWQIKTWYHSPYPLASAEDEEASVSAASTRGTGRGNGRGGYSSKRGAARGRGRIGESSSPSNDSMLWVCDRCFKYMRDGAMMELHMQTSCKTILHPPGKKVYQRGGHIIWEIDSANEKLFCQNLSLFGKFFIDVKTLFFDCDNFMFFILTEDQGQRDVPIGFFSKEKRSFDGYNLACIVVFPPYQRKRYGVLMIEFSYELSRRAGTLGTPERPLSELGLRSYLTYWIGALVQLFRRILSVRPLTDIKAPNNNEPINEDLVKFVNKQPSGQGPGRKKSPNGGGGTWEAEAENMYHDENVVAATSGADDALFGHMRWMHTDANPDGSATTHVFGRCTLEDISKATSLRIDDIAFALNECGLLQHVRSLDGEETKEVIVISREMVEKVAQDFRVKKMNMEVQYVLYDRNM